MNEHERSLVLSGQRITAVVAYRKRTGADLKTAAEASWAILPMGARPPNLAHPFAADANALLADYHGAA